MAAVTARTPGNGTSTLSYTLTSDTFDVESVYVSIDATGAGGAVTAELTIADQSGAVIARKVQTQTVAAGGTGSATWALRLDDDGGAGGGGGITLLTSTGGSVTITNPAGPTANLEVAAFSTGNGSYSASVAGVAAGSGANFSWSYVSGTALLDLTAPTLPKVLAAGHYGVVIWVQGSTTIGLGDEIKLQTVMTDTTPGPAPQVIQDCVPGTLVNPQLDQTMIGWLPTNGTIQATFIVVTAAAAQSASATMWVTKLG